MIGSALPLGQGLDAVYLIRRAGPSMRRPRCRSRVTGCSRLCWSWAWASARLNRKPVGSFRPFVGPSPLVVSKAACYCSMLPAAVTRTREGFALLGRTLLDAIADYELYPLCFLAVTTGMCRGEVAGLRWRDLDLNAARLTVSQQVVPVEYELIEDDFETASSRRDIDLDEQTVAMLRRHRRHQLEQRMVSRRRGDDVFVFSEPDRSVHPDLIS